ncbi:MAG: helix-turn-helix domain-containing protein [Candidatus Acidiferrum sp.]
MGIHKELERKLGGFLGDAGFLRYRLPAVPRHQLPRALTIPAAARYLSCSVKFVRTLIWSRQIKYVKVGRRFVIATAELDRWLSENQRHA